MRSRRFSREVLIFLVAVPVAWGILLLFHPGGSADDVYGSIHDQVTAMLVVHIGMLIFIPLMAAAIYLLVRDYDSTAARVTKISLPFFVVFYIAWETLQGIANGILVGKVNDLPGSERETGVNLVQDFAESPLARDLGVFATIGTLGLIVALIGAGITLRREARAPLSVALLLGLSGFLISAHPPPLGPTGLALFVAAVLMFARSPATPRPASA